jgi:predicted membrane chloride channel (bestrophin family)
MLCVQCWKAAMFLFAWVINTTTEFQAKIFIAVLLTFATDFYKGVYEKYVEGADAWQMLKAGLDAMVLTIIAEHFKSHF